MTTTKWTWRERGDVSLTGEENSVFGVVAHISDGEFVQDQINSFSTFENLLCEFVQGMFSVSIHFSNELNEGISRSMNDVERREELTSGNFDSRHCWLCVTARALSFGINDWCFRMSFCSVLWDSSKWVSALWSWSSIYVDGNEETEWTRTRFTWENSLSTSSSVSLLRLNWSSWLGPRVNNRPIIVSFVGLFHP